MSLQTPEAIRMLQRKLYRKAKQEPRYRFYLLYDKIYREDFLSHAYALAKANDGAPGVDGESFAQIEAAGCAQWLRGIREQLRAKSYRPQPVRRVMLAKPGGGERPLGIPTIRDRVVQTAAKLVLEPIFEADLEPSAYGYRVQRSAQEAIARVHELLCQGYVDVVDADLSKYLDPSSHYTSICGLRAEEIGVSGRYLDSQAFSSSAADVHGVKFAALYTLQDCLARDTKEVRGFEHRHVTFGHVLHEARTQFIVESDAPRRTGRDLFSGDETIVEPAM
jgi:hypothetical protein